MIIKYKYIIRIKCLYRKSSVKIHKKIILSYKNFYIVISIDDRKSDHRRTYVRDKLKP